MATEKNGPGIKIPIYKPYMKGNEEKYVLECLRSGWVSSAGSFVEKLEKKFADYIGTSHSTSCSNGTTALHLAQLALGIGPGDEVIVPDFTFVSTASTVVHCSATPVLADINPQTLNIDPASIEEKITKKTKAIIPVHIYGNPAPMKEIMEIAQKHDLLVIEDAAEAHGAMIGGKKVGTFGDASIFSFYGNKIMTTGEGGMVVSNDEKTIEKAKLLKNHGASKEKKYWHEVVAYNYRLTNIQAALGLAQLEMVEEIIEKKRKVAQNYAKLFSESGFVLPNEEKGTRNVYWLYWFMDKSPKFNFDAAAQKLSAFGIESRPLFYPLSVMPPFKRSGLVNSVKVYKTGMCLPSFPDLTFEEQEKVARAILE